MGARSRPGLWTEVLRAIQASEVVVAVFIFGDVFGLWQEFYFFFSWLSLYISFTSFLLCICAPVLVCVFTYVCCACLCV